MIVKTRSTRIPLLIAAILLVAVASMSLSRQRLREEMFGVIDTVVAQDWGISGLAGLYGDSLFREFGSSGREIATGLLLNFPTRVLVRLPHIFLEKLEGFPGRPPVGRIDIDIKFEDYQKLLSDRQRALAAGMLADPQEVKARIRYHEKRIKADVRLKGDLYDHWRSRTSMSLRVDLKGKDTIFGFSQFSLHKPGSRQFPYDHVFQDFIRSLGGLSARHNFVHVFMNGQNWGIMDVEEHMSKELLEKQERKESIILKIGNESKWYYNTVNADPYARYRLSDPKLYILPFQEKSYLAQPLSRAHYSYVVQKFANGREAEILDTDSFSRAALAATLWNAYHTLANINSRFYFNPYVLKLEPITTDQSRLEKIESTENPVQSLYKAESGWLYKVALSSPRGRERFERNLDAVLQAAEKIPSIAGGYQAFFPNDRTRSFEDITANIETMRKAAKPLPLSDTPVPAVANHASLTPQQAASIPVHVFVRHYDDGRLLLFNLLDVPVHLESIAFDGSPVDFAAKVISPYTENNGMLEIQTGKTGIQDGRFQIKTSLLGNERVTENGATILSRLFNPLEDNRAGLPSWIQKTGEGYEVRAGTWVVRNPLVVGGSLAIPAGTTLRFAENAYLIVKGGALIASGTARKPVVFEPVKNHWKGIYVAEGESQSVLRNTIIKNTDFFQDGLLSLTGGINFYKSPVHLENTQIIGTIAEDALNIIGSEFIISGCIIANTTSDALDSDFSNGKITSTIIENTGGDAVDFSGSTVTIDGLTARHVHDKAVSVGEKSIVTVRNSAASDVGVGIAAKDGSIVTADSVSVSKYALHAAMSYIKKDMFGPPHIRILNMTHDGESPFLRQVGTEMYVDGIPVKAEKIDVEKIYTEGIMKK